MIYLVTLGGIAGLVLGGMLLGAFQLDDGPRALVVLVWSSLWLGILSWLCIRNQSVADQGLTWCRAQDVFLGLAAGLLGMPLASLFAGAVRETLGLDPVNPQLAYILIEGASVWLTLESGSVRSDPTTH